MKKKIPVLICIAICIAYAYCMMVGSAKQPILTVLYVVSFGMTVNALAVAGILAALKSDVKDGDGIINDDQRGDDDEEPS